ncbi:MAG: CocE/NonD family hydrolase [Myxococcota bacterium]
MRVVRSLPCRVREEENVFIPMRDGTRLAARLWVPEGAEEKPVPAILEYIPYRKRDLERKGDDIDHGYFAGHGYACARVDLRGSGDSEGVLRDEYLQQELDDGVEVLRWLAAQPWCDGNVGMYGISWGGFNGLQIAAMRPPELKAVITACSTDDRYADDVHYMGGCLLLDNLAWAAVMFAHNTFPPDPEVVGERWREMWLERLRGSGLWLETWLRHPHRDAYWKHGSVCEDYDAIQCPVFAVSGWADGYSNAVFRLLGGLSVPRRGLVGPWSHAWPHVATPGPAIGFLQECLRWWDRWLKGVDNGIEEEPMLQVFMQDTAPPRPRYASRPGRWVGEATWPSTRIDPVRWALAPHRLVPQGESVSEADLELRTPLGVGRYAGKWCAYDTTPDLPSHQAFEDGGSLVFDTEPRDAPLEILGAPVLELDVSSDRPAAQLAARLSDVAPDGSITRVTYGVLNLNHRNGHERSEPLEPGRWYRVRLRLNEVAQHFPAGHRVRLALSSSYWPLIWPSPAPSLLRVRAGSSTLLLPSRPPRAEDESLRPFDEPEGAPLPITTVLREPQRNRWVVHDLGDDRHTLQVLKDDGEWRLEAIGLELSARAEETYGHVGNDHLSVRGETRYEHRFRRGDWDVRTVTRMVLTSTADHHRLVAEADAWEGDARVHCESWDVKIPRE